MADNKVAEKEVVTPTRTKKLLDQVGGETGPLGPMVKMLNKLMDDPVLKQALESLPQDTTPKH